MEGGLRSIGCCLGLMALLCATASAGVRDGVQPSDVALSNERTVTRWAYVADTQPIYDQPSSSATVLARLHWDTEDGYPEIYLLLRAHWDEQGQEWIELRIPGRPNGRVGWVTRDAIEVIHMTRELVVIDRERMRLTLYSSGRLLWSVPVGVGAPRTPTPPGHFWIREKFKVQDPASGYYPWAFGTAAYSHLTDWPGGGVVGIHGPYHAPASIPGRSSHGCIRLRVQDDAKLARDIGPGTPVLVH